MANKRSFFPLLEAELMAKREAPPTEATALEALLRGDGLLDKRNSNSKDEETLLEIQVAHPKVLSDRLWFCRAR